MQVGEGAQRWGWADLIRGAAVLVVVVYHAGYGLLAAPGTTGAWFVGFLLPVCMPMLLVLSGVFAARGLNRAFGSYARTVARNRVWPWMVWTVVMAVVWPLHLSTDPVNFLTIGTHTWFLGVLICASMLAYLVRPLPPAVPAAALLLTSAVLKEEHAIISFYFLHSAFFFVGLALANHLQRWLLASPGWVIGTGALGAAAGVLQVSAVPAPGPLEALLSVCAAMTCMWIAARIPRSLPVRWLEWVGRHALVIYLVHFPVVVLVPVALTGVGLDPWESSTLAFAISLAVSLAVVGVRRWAWGLFTAPPLGFLREGPVGSQVTLATERAPAQ